MKLVTVHFGGIYCIGICRDYWGVETQDSFIRSMIKISEDDYVKIIKRHGGINDGCFSYYFDEHGNCQSVIEELEPFLVMAKLTGE